MAVVVVVAVVAVVVVLWWWLLGPMVVALARPLWLCWSRCWSVGGAATDCVETSWQQWAAAVGAAAAAIVAAIAPCVILTQY